MNRVKKWDFKTVLANYPEPYRIMGPELKDNLTELHITARNRLKSAQRRPSIIAACWSQATLW